MAAKKRKPGFDVPPGKSDAEWVYRSDPKTTGDAAPTPPAAPPEGETAAVALTASYARLPDATSAKEAEGNDMEVTKNAQAPGTLLVNGAKVLGEVAIVPGASLIVDGQVKSGIFHAAGGLLSIAVLGPVFGKLAWLALGADSYSRSVSGKTIVDQFSNKPTAAQ